jgi:hypothetical protein
MAALSKVRLLPAGTANAGMAEMNIKAQRKVRVRDRSMVVLLVVV